MILYVVRHGDPIYDPDSLTELGHMQAKALAHRFAVHGLDKIYASTLIRAQQTAQPTCNILNKKMELLDWTSEAHTWQEFTFIQENGMRNWCFHIQTTDYKTEENLALGDKWYEAYPFNQSKSKEGWERIQRESDAFLSKLGYERDGLRYKILEPNDQKVAVFCHQGFGTTWLAHLLGMNPISFWSSFDLNHSSVTTLYFKNNNDGYTAPLCIGLSDCSHIYADRLPQKFQGWLKY